LTPIKPAVFFAAVSVLATARANQAETPRRIEIVAKRFTYDPDVITLKKGEPVVLVMRSSDVTHGLKVEELNLESEDIKKGGQSEIRFTPEKTGHYIGKCAHFCGKGHGSMTLQIDVVP
jgi:cytochrome c oxidase subunit 2